MSKRKTPGAGHVPAPRGGDEQAMRETADQLRALLREAHGVLGDLARERKAVEQLARDHAEKAITTHVNSMLQELTAHVDRQNKYIAEQQRTYLRAVADDFLKRWATVDLKELTDAVGVVRQLKELFVEEEAKRSGGTD